MRAKLLVLALTSNIAACGTETRDPGDPPIDPGPACARALDASTGEIELFRFEDAAKSIVVHVERAWAAQGSGHSAIYALKSFSIFRDGTCHALAEGDAGLDYESSHHNWADRARATIHGTTYEVAFDFDFGVQGRGWIVTLSAPDIAATELFVRGAPLGCWQCPGFVPVWITEVLVENDDGHKDEAGDADPWIELWNPSSEAVDLSGWTVTAGGTANGTFTFPSGSTIARHGFVIVWLDNEPSEGALHAPFTIQKTGTTLRLAQPDETSAGARTFNSPGVNQSLDYSGTEKRFVAGDPTPGTASERQL